MHSVRRFEAIREANVVRHTIRHFQFHDEIDFKKSDFRIIWEKQFWRGNVWHTRCNVCDSLDRHRRGSGSEGRGSIYDQTEYALATSEEPGFVNRGERLLANPVHRFWE